MPVESGTNRRIMGLRRPLPEKEGRSLLKSRIGKSKKNPIGFNTVK